MVPKAPCTAILEQLNDKFQSWFELGFKVIFVFDGRKHPLKSDEHEKRKQLHENAYKKLKILWKDVRREQLMTSKSSTSQHFQYEWIYSMT